MRAGSHCNRLGLGLALMIGIWTASEAWALTATPAAITFQSIQGSSNPPSQTLILSKSDTLQTSWLAMDNATWLKESPAVGTITSTGQVTLAVNTAGLAAGTYTATVTITVDKVGSTSVPVTLKVVSASSSGSSMPPPPPPPSTTPGSSTAPPPPPPSPGSSTTPPPTSTNTMATLTWSPVTSTNLAGYKVYVGTASGRYGTPLTVGNVTSYVVSNLVLGNTYYFVVTSYSTSGSESSPSNEVSKSIY